MSTIKKSILFIVFLSVSVTVFSQFGARVKYNLNTLSGFDSYIDANTNGNNDKIFASSIGVGIDYWFRLKKYRIEFLPEAHMGLKSKSNFENNSTNTNFSYFGVNFNTQIYLFDLEGDCDCPTFSKQGPSLSKGVFINVSPGVLYNTKEIATELVDPTIKSNQINFKIGLGLGYDIGISNLFTITPMFNYNLAPGLLFNDLQNIGSIPTKPPVIESSLNQLQFQIRFGFRPDYVKSYGRRR
ncbi:MAG: hypothetical protein ACI9P5_003647 [Saprospiraceae bacterium]|jgi:hypothetical protein|tara:strand:+ start:3092 stop:3814 length:723 start_codon:yes stop_codon:yes gene_type:complete